MLTTNYLLQLILHLASSRYSVLFITLLCDIYKTQDVTTWIHYYDAQKLLSSFYLYLSFYLSFFILSVVSMKVQWPKEISESLVAKNTIILIYLQNRSDFYFSFYEEAICSSCIIDRRKVQFLYKYIFLLSH
jgi:hypothetical protein